MPLTRVLLCSALALATAACADRALAPSARRPTPIRITRTPFQTGGGEGAALWGTPAEIPAHAISGSNRRGPGLDTANLRHALERALRTGPTLEPNPYLSADPISGGNAPLGPVAWGDDGWLHPGTPSDPMSYVPADLQGPAVIHDVTSTLVGTERRVVASAVLDYTGRQADAVFEVKWEGKAGGNLTNAPTGSAKSPTFTHGVDFWALGFPRRTYAPTYPVGLASACGMRVTGGVDVNAYKRFFAVYPNVVDFKWGLVGAHDELNPHEQPSCQVAQCGAGNGGEGGGTSPVEPMLRASPGLGTHHSEGSCGGSGGGPWGSSMTMTTCYGNHVYHNGRYAYSEILYCHVHQMA